MYYFQKDALYFKCDIFQSILSIFGRNSGLLTVMLYGNKKSKPFRMKASILSFVIDPFLVT